MVPKEFEDLFLLGVQKNDFPRYIYKYRLIDSNFCNALVNNYLWFSSFDDFNDPFDGRLKYPKQYSRNEINHFLQTISSIHDEKKIKEKTEYLYNNQDELSEIISNAIADQKKETKVCCFSQINDSILMWSHYADGHKGVCLEFDVTKDPSVFCTLQKVVYQPEYSISNYLLDSKNTILNMLKIKSQDWQYEHEYRVIRPQETCNKIYYKPEALVSIIFGCNCPRQDITNITRIIGSRVKYKKCVLDNDYYKVNIVDV